MSKITFLPVLSETIVKGKPIQWAEVRSEAQRAEHDHFAGVKCVGLKPILTAPTGNQKLTKGEGLPVYSLSLAPANLSGYEVCPWRTVDCTRGCIGHTAGNARFPGTVLGRIARTVELAENPYRFFRRLLKDLDKAKYDTNGSFAYRSNAFSDIPWLSILPSLNTFAERNYNYTKSTEMAFRSLRMRKHMWMFGLNQTVYEQAEHLTLSFTGDNLKDCLLYLKEGGNVAVIMAKRKSDPIPATLWGFPTVDGDANDRRYMDPQGSIAVLTPKGGLDRTRKWVVAPNDRLEDRM